MPNQEEFDLESEFETENELKENWLSRNLVCITSVLIALLLGLSIMGWQFWKASSETQTAKNELIETNKSLKKEKIRTLIMSAVIEANRGDYDLALVDTSRFFNSLRNEIDKKDDSAYFAEEKIQLKKTFENQDATIAAIARREDQAVNKLLDIYSSYLKSVSEFRKGNPRKEKKIEGESNTNMQDDINANTDNQNSATNQAFENTNVGNQTVVNTSSQNTNSGGVNTNQLQ